MRRRCRPFCRLLRLAGVCAVLFVLPSFPTTPQEPSSREQYPEVESLQRSDILFRQLVSDIDLFYRRQKSNGPLPPLAFFSYRVKEEESLFTIAARFNLPYDTIATLNGLANPQACTSGKQLLIPNRPGIFVPQAPRTALETLVAANSARYKEEKRRVTVYTKTEKTRTFDFFPGSRFSGTERAFFLHVFFRMPLPSGVITSGYGSRTSPISNRRHFHHGLDIAAPEGTEVMAARGGTVSRAGTDEELGMYVVIEHDGGFTTTYGHLAEKVVEKGDQVHYGTLIGYVGSTGLSTGPHLHFEIRSGSQSKDPLQLLPVRTQ